MTAPHFLFDSIFSNTHSELSSIRDQMEELQMNYQSNETNEITIPYEGESSLIDIVIEPVLMELEDESILDEPILDEPILNNDQINKFKKIYSKSKIEDIDDGDNNSIDFFKFIYL